MTLPISSELTKWARDKSKDETYADNWHALSQAAAQFWIKAAFAEIERRAKVEAEDDGVDEYWVGHAVRQLQQEWFGEGRG